jgi:hypothetical protein
MLELFNAEVMLTRFPGKGGWTYAPVGQLPFKVKTHIGNLKVCGRLNEVALEEAHLMPMGKGLRFLPVNAELRKKLGKQAGDVVRLQLFVVEKPNSLALSLADFRECLAEVPVALHAFEALGASQQQALLEQVAEADNEQQQVARVEAVIAQLAQGVVAG